MTIADRKQPRSELGRSATETMLPRNYRAEGLTCESSTLIRRVVRGVMLKGPGFDDISTELVALLAMLLIVYLVAVSRERGTLD